MGDDFFQALANPYRREIIRLLKWRSRTAGEIAAHFSISQPSISRHLDVLKRAEIITAERRGFIYELKKSTYEQVECCDCLLIFKESKKWYIKSKMLDISAFLIVSALKYKFYAIVYDIIFLHTDQAIA